MSVISEDEIRSLAAIRSRSAAITSCYLDVDGRRHIRPVDYHRVLETMLRDARNGGHVPAATLQDLDRIERHVKAGVDRSGVRGLAIFAGGADDLWRVVELPVPVRSELIVNASPAVGQLEGIVQQAFTVGVLAVDRTRARVFVYRLGELVEHTEVEGDRSRDYDTTGEHDRGGVDDHREEMALQHLRHAAELLWSAHQAHQLDHVTLATPDHVVSEVERNLHPYLRERLCRRLDVEPTAPVTRIRDAALDLAFEIEREKEAASVAELRDAVASNGRGVAGLGPVLDALAEQRVERLLVSDGYAAEGWRCPDCDRLAAVGRACPHCGAEMTPVPDVVEHAVDDAMGQSSAVDVCTDNADLDVLGRIGALLRY